MHCPSVKNRENRASLERCSVLRSLITALIGGSRPHFDGAPASTSTVTTAGIVFGTWAGTLNASIDLGIAQY